MDKVIYKIIAWSEGNMSYKYASKMTDCDKERDNHVAEFLRWYDHVEVEEYRFNNSMRVK